MDLWTYFNGFWVIPLLCFLFMALMMVFGCHGMRFGCGHGGGKAPSPEEGSPEAPK
jgi:hypothetical protein